MRTDGKHNLVELLHRPLTASERSRIVDRTGQVWQENAADFSNLYNAFLIVGPPVLMSFLHKSTRAIAFHPVVDFPELRERFYREEPIDDLNMSTWHRYYGRVT